MPTKTGLRLFGHPVHPMLVHLPMGLLLTAPLWDLIGLVRSGGAAISAAVGEWTLAVGCLGGLAAAVAGMIDFGALPDGHPAGRAAHLHLYLILAALALFGSSLLVRHRHGAAGPAEPTLALLGLDLAGVLCLAAGGYFGAEMVYRYGVGRQSAATEPRGSGYHQAEQ